MRNTHYDSILHYEVNAFTKNIQSTIINKVYNSYFFINIFRPKIKLKSLSITDVMELARVYDAVTTQETCFRTENTLKYIDLMDDPNYKKSQ